MISELSCRGLVFFTSVYIVVLCVALGHIIYSTYSERTKTAYTIAAVPKRSNGMGLGPIGLVPSQVRILSAANDSLFCRALFCGRGRGVF